MKIIAKLKLSLQRAFSAHAMQYYTLQIEYSPLQADSSCPAVVDGPRRYGKYFTDLLSFSDMLSSSMADRSSYAEIRPDDALKKSFHPIVLPNGGTRCQPRQWTVETLSDSSLVAVSYVRDGIRFALKPGLYFQDHKDTQRVLYLIPSLGWSSWF